MPHIGDLPGLHQGRGTDASFDGIEQCSPATGRLAARGKRTYHEHVPQIVRLASVNDFPEWRAVARGLLLAGIPPEEVAWVDPAAPDLLASIDPAPQRVV